MQRVLVIGNSGAGKSTTGRKLAARLGVVYVELDSIFHQPGWTELPADEFRLRVRSATQAAGWVIDGNYSVVRDLLWERADTVVWVDPPRVVVMARVIRRSLARVVFRRELWAGNRERLRNLLSINPRTSIIAWAWTRHGVYRDRYEAAMTDPALSHLRFIRLRSRREERTLLLAAPGVVPFTVSEIQGPPA